MELMEEILTRENLNQAYKKVVANKGASGVDGVTVEELVKLPSPLPSPLCQH